MASAHSGFTPNEQTGPGQENRAPKLVSELEGYHRVAQTAHATHEQSKAENKYDTRGLETSYLAHRQARQMMEMEAAITALKNMDIRTFGPGAPLAQGRWWNWSTIGNGHFTSSAPRLGAWN